MRARSAMMVAVAGWLAGAMPLGAQSVTQASAADDALVREALSAAPKDIAIAATVVAPGPDGTSRELKRGTNGWTCMPDAPETPGKDPMCLDAEGMKWAMDWMAHKPRPTNAAPGLAYMLRGGSDISATDPWAKPTKDTKFIESPPHYMVLWPFDPKESGFSETPKRTGTWVMWAGTPYAHLMVNQKP